MSRFIQRTSRLFLAASLALSTNAHAQATPAQVDAPVQKFLKAFNAAMAATTTSAAGMTIADEFAPHLWAGKTALADWGAAFDANAKASGITGPAVSLGAPLVCNISGDHADIIYPAIYT